MKTIKLSALLAFLLLSFSACKKLEDVAPTTPVTPVVSTATNTVTPVKYDTIPDKAIFKLQLVKDSSNYDETMFIFDHKASLNYSGNEDGAYFPGYGEESLASISNDGKDLAINDLPFTQGMAIGLDMNVKTGGAYFFKLSYASKIPATMKIWVKDTYMKDSVDVRSGHYDFTVNKADANSYGSKRFQIILKDSGQTSGK
jgi:hypothetical protein